MTAKSKDNHPIVLIGGGPVGLVLALSMQKQGLPVNILEAKVQGASYQDRRALALSYGSKQILEQLNVWDKVEMQATSIHSIHVSQSGSLGRSRLVADDYQLPALGYVLAYGDLMQALDSTMIQEDITYGAAVTNVDLSGEEAMITYEIYGKQSQQMTTLAVVAEGGRSLNAIDAIQRETKAYGHDALVSKVSCERPHNNIAYERFTANGPMALLPNGEHDFSLVWTGEKAEVDALLGLDDSHFLAQLHQAFGDRVGRFLTIDKRMSFPLIKSSLSNQVNPHLVVIGNAAQTMHPVAGQGFNVGLRDAVSLVKQLSKVDQSSWGDVETLKEYADTRTRDTKGGLLFTDFLVTTFSNDIVGLSQLRSVGLGLLDVVSPAKQLLVNRMSYGK